MANSAPAVNHISEIVETREVRDCLQWFAREKQWINEQHLQLCRIPAPTFFEQRRAEWVAAPKPLIAAPKNEPKIPQK